MTTSCLIHVSRREILLSMDPTHGVLAVSIAQPDGESKTTLDGDGGASSTTKRQPLKDLASQPL
ncbi:uncharacterized protein SCHCODRAFT_02605897 [Schizophyllum commune H4-8]|uniref:uncharacterized protein n=1 Tax=Schizophyllum commune (strain H4-8 / FGSC 9210) TaxID=578458 RepID=UPI00215EE8D3|nr:uncharacterized protein SCHCODRAFT_02605897 [Schizophyllum commune H4-8]KAI5899707.1 hypothetical protein SCHCODRAFT_02605897 [Schizophyllum commune H4-8]